MKRYQDNQHQSGQEMIVARSLRAYSVYRSKYAGPELQAFLAGPDEAIDSLDAMMLKDGNSQTVVLLRMDGRDTVIKRYNLKSPWHRLRRALRTTRAQFSWRNALQLEQLGIHTPAAVAILECRAGIFRGRSYFLSEYNPGQDGRQWFLDPAIELKDKRVVADRLVDMFALFAKHHIVHGDTKASNFLVEDQVPVVIDLDIMCEYSDPKKFRAAQARDIHRFMRNWETSPEIAGLFKSGLHEHWPDLV